MATTCFHCGDNLRTSAIKYDEKEFCCTGCKTVYTLLKENHLGEFYTLEKGAGSKPGTLNEGKYDFLEVEAIRNRFIDFHEGSTVHIVLFLPEIHCASCIYLLENLSKINSAILNCQVSFSKREASISFDATQLKLSELALLLDRIGYAPNFGNRQEQSHRADKIFLYKLGIAGFAFGSIMLWSFPEYLGIENDNPEFRNFTSLLSFGVSIPVILFSARDYFTSAFKALRSRHLNLDVPITIGILALYLQSSYTIISGNGPGYMDSFAGFIFFLLIGKWFQRKTYRSLSFERDHTSYFPVAVTRKTTSNTEEIVAIEELHEDDTIYMRNEEILPCDSLLLSDEAHIDYSFVTGESATIKKYKGDQVFAGGKLRDKRTEFKVLKKSDRSHLTRLWNEVKGQKEGESTEFEYQNKLSFYFLIGLLLIAAVSALIWSMIDPGKVVSVTVAILIVACPCALALSAPFTFGNIMRVLGRGGLYLKHTGIIEKLNTVTDIVFDKTGTLTSNEIRKIEYTGDELSSAEWHMLFTLANSSTHPNSKSIADKLQKDGFYECEGLSQYLELKGNGIQGSFDTCTVKIGNADFCNVASLQEMESVSFIRVGDRSGKFVFSSELRPGVSEMLESLSHFNVHLLSGDSPKDEALLEKYFQKDNMHFAQSPQNKHDYIKALQDQGRSVLMVGDGLNDAGALGKANVGIAVSEDVFRFAPSSDAIIDASKLSQLDGFIGVSRFSTIVLRSCLIFSLSYNVIGLSFACSGQLTPLVAAILMPVSSITVVLISTFMSLSQGKKLKPKNMI